jgi:hypothetical protein
VLLCPLDENLRRSTDGHPGLGLGLEERWTLPRNLELRVRGEWGRFPEGRDRTDAQVIHTRVERASLGVEGLLRGKAALERLSVGAGLYLLRWSVDSRNRFVPPVGEPVRASGRSHWLRPGCGVLCTWRLGPDLELEGRLLWSRWGYEDRATGAAGLGLTWQF